MRPRAIARMTDGLTVWQVSCHSHLGGQVRLWASDTRVNTLRKGRTRLHPEDTNAAGLRPAAHVEKLVCMVALAGIEPAANGLGNHCSIP